MTSSRRLRAAHTPTAALLLVAVASLALAGAEPLAPAVLGGPSPA